MRDVVSLSAAGRWIPLSLVRVIWTGYGVVWWSRSPRLLRSWVFRQTSRSSESTKVIAALGSDPAGQEIAAAWIGKEKLRHALNLRARVTGSVPGERDVRGRLFAFYDWCAQNDDIPDLLSLARTVSRWENEIVAAVLTGITNSVSERLNRLAKLEARLAYGFRNPVNQRRRVRIACTRGARRRSRNATARKTRLVTGRQHDPG